MAIFYILLIASMGLPIVWAIASAVTASGLRKKFTDMRTIAGKTKGEIYLLAGPPNSVTSLGEGRELLQWQVTGYHIALSFTNEVCDGVTHEHSV